MDNRATTDRTPAPNSTYPKGGVSCSKDSFVVNQTLVFQIKVCGKSPARTQSRKPLAATTKPHHYAKNTTNFFFQLFKKPHHFQAHRKRAKRQQHFCEELEKFIIQLCSCSPIQRQV
jgi:hypothetical protein